MIAIKAIVIASQCLCLSALADTTSTLQRLKPFLSSGATISSNTSGLPRLSSFDAPDPGAILNVATEEDVAVTVRFCDRNRIPVLTQNGGHGWSTSLSVLNKSGIILNLGGLKHVSFNSAKTQITLQGGALVSDVIAAANNNSALVPTGTCNCIGMLGAVLGGGVGNLMGFHGLGVDNLLSLKVVTAHGRFITVSPTQNTDLWYAMRGAGPNFGIVTSAVMKSFPVDAVGLNAWLGPLVFTSPQLEALINTINTLNFTPQMAMSLLFANSGNTTAPPTIICSVYYYGNETAGKAAFAPLYNVGPVADETKVTPYAQWNVANDVACGKGPRKPNFGVGLGQMDQSAWRAVYEEFSSWIQQPGAEHSTVMMDAYSLSEAQTMSDTDSSFPFRHSISFNAIWAAQYEDPSIDSIAIQYGQKARDLWRATSGLSAN